METTWFCKTIAFTSDKDSFASKDAQVHHNFYDWTAVMEETSDLASTIRLKVAVISYTESSRPDSDLRDFYLSITQS